MMTTSDARLLDGTDVAIEKAMMSLVQFRKVLKAIKGNACLLSGKTACWADSINDEPSDIARETGRISSIEETPLAQSMGDAQQAKIDKDQAEVDNMEAEMAETMKKKAAAIGEELLLTAFLAPAHYGDGSRSHAKWSSFFPPVAAVA